MNMDINNPYAISKSLKDKHKITAYIGGTPPESLFSTRITNLQIINLNLNPYKLRLNDL